MNQPNYPNNPNGNMTPAGPPDNTKLFSILAYIPFLWLVGLLADRQNPRVIYHVNQGIIFTVCCAVINVALSILSGVLLFILPILSILTGLVTVVVSLAEIGVMVIGIVNAANGEEKPLPVIGNLFVAVR